MSKLYFLQKNKYFKLSNNTAHTKQSILNIFIIKVNRSNKTRKLFDYSICISYKMKHEIRITFLYLKHKKPFFWHLMWNNDFVIVDLFLSICLYDKLQLYSALFINLFTYLCPVTMDTLVTSAKFTDPLSDPYHIKWWIEKEWYFKRIWSFTFKVNIRIFYNKNRKNTTKRIQKSIQPKRMIIKLINLYQIVLHSTLIKFRKNPSYYPE
jgi:hypothetical protein